MIPMPTAQTLMVASSVTAEVDTLEMVFSVMVRFLVSLIAYA